MGICCMAQETQTQLCISLEGWDGEGNGREVQKAEDIYIYIYIPMANSCSGLTENNRIV